MALSKAITFVFLLLIVHLSQPIPIINAEDDKPTEPNFEDYRLSNEVKPKQYSIELTLNENFLETKKFNGKVTITLLTTKKPTKKEITLNANKIKVISATLKGKGDIPVTYATLEELERVVIKTKDNKELTEDEYVLEINYEGEFRKDMSGFYLSKVQTGDEEDNEYVAATQFQPTSARKAFPCFDEPEYRAPFEIRIIHPKTYKALSNRNGKQTPGPDNLVTSVFEATPPMSTYLLAFVVSKMTNIDELNDAVGDNRAWTQSGLIAQAKYAHSIGPKIIEALNKYTGINYQDNMQKLDQVAIPDFSAGAMENWGLVTYRESALLHDEHESSHKNKQRVATIVAHELAHMWFGNLVTLKWWSSTWLNEGFAAYFQYFATDKVESGWEMENQFVVEKQHSILISDASESSEPLTLPESKILTPTQISGRFGSITYDKGASVIRMMKHFLGEAEFDKGIKKYLKDNKLDNIEPGDLWDSFKPTSRSLPNSVALDKVMDAWINKKGFPVVQVSQDQNKPSSVILTQSKFAWKEESTKDKETTTGWYIPISYTTSNDTDYEDTTPKTWLTPDLTKSVSIKNALKEEKSWILLNIKDSAYYRVNYDKELWMNLKENALNAEQLKNIDVLNRAQIVDDVLNLARADIVDYDLALDVVSYLENEIDYYPWYAAFNAFAYLKRRIDSEHEVAKKLNEYIKSLMDKVYNSVSFDVRSDSQIESYKRALVINWACKLGVTGCFENSVNAFMSFRENHINVDPDLRSTVYCAALSNTNSDEDWEFLNDRLKTTQLPSERANIIAALGCSLNADKLTKFLDESLKPNSTIRDQDINSVYTSIISASSFGLLEAYEYLKKNIEPLKKRYDLASLITATADRFTRTDQIDDLEEFINENELDIGKDVKARAEKAIKQARKNIVWFENVKTEILEYLNSRVVVTTPIDDTTEHTPTTLPTTTTTKDNGATSITFCSTVLIAAILKAVLRI